MRFLIQDGPFWGRAQYTIHLGNSTIPVRNPPLLRQLKDRERMVFTWADGGDCTITGPNPPVGAIDIISPLGRVWSGQPVDPQWKLSRPTIFLWHLENHIVACEARRVCCRRLCPVALVLTLKWDRSRLATWFVHRPLQGSLRKDLPEDMKPVVIGMILSTIYDFCPSG